jgi:hypothetical protein
MSSNRNTLSLQPQRGTDRPCPSSGVDTAGRWQSPWCSGALAVLAALTGLCVARVVAGGCAVVATVCLITVKFHVLGGSDDRDPEYPGE